MSEMVTQKYFKWNSFSKMIHVVMWGSWSEVGQVK